MWEQSLAMTMAMSCQHCLPLGFLLRALAPGFDIPGNIPSTVLPEANLSLDPGLLPGFVFCSPPCKAGAVSLATRPEVMLGSSKAWIKLGSLPFTIHSSTLP